MLKPLLFIAVTANLLFKTTVADPKSRAYASATSVASANCDNEDDTFKCEGPNEVFDICPPECPPQRCDVDIALILCAVPPQPGDPECKPGCRCIDDYVRNSYGICIPRDQCEPQCGVNEQYEKYPAALCRPQNCSQVGFPIACPGIDANSPGNPACVCITDHARNDDGICVPLDQCPSCRGDSNARSGCGFCGHRCSDIGKDVACLAICEANGCECKEGYNYDEVKKKCVLRKNCTPNCKADKNEVYSECINGGCQAVNCSQLGKPIPCIKLDPKSCIKGCICKEDYLRAPNGSCILKDQCNPCKGPREYYDTCPPSCPPQTCESIGQRYSCPMIPAKPSPQYCKPACRCEKGFLRNKNGECISKDDCQQQCGVNEQYEKYPAALCRPLNCSQVGFPIACPRIDPSSPGNPACVCIADHARNDNGVCVPLGQCPSCRNDSNAISGCGFCGHRCSDIGKNNTVCPLICEINGCQCKKGYFHDSVKNRCVLPDECTPVCGENEVPSDCVNGGCDKRICTQVGQPTICIDPIKCKKVCVCKQGYLRDAKGICVSIQNCSSCGNDPNAISGCGFCGHRCSDLGKGPVACPRICEVDGCQCKKGYYHDRVQNKCVPPENCTCSEPNEVFDLCPNTCRPQTCESLDKAYSCPIEQGKKKSCKPGCRCKDGYYRNINGQCNTKEQCLQCNGSHEYFNCGGACDNVCDKLSEYNQTNCHIVNIMCNPMCYCEKGYARAINKTCIPISSCKERQCGVNEVLSDCANGGCDRRNCSQLGYPPICLNVKKCFKGCVCKKGYLRNEKGICVRISECPPVCREDEVYNSCIQGHCLPTNCSQLGYSVACPRIDPRFCIKGCICKEDKVRADNGTCIPKNQCPSCGGDPNAVAGCGTNYNKLCADVGKKPKPHNDTCESYVNSCDCRDGFYLNPNNGKCVCPDQCTPTCDLPHEVYDPCPLTCPPQTCSSVDRKFHCPRILVKGKPYCRGACRCEKNYYRNPIGECISRENCLKCKGLHEYFSCGPSSDNECAKLDTQNKQTSLIENNNCTERCYCEDGYARNSSNICIPIDDCDTTTTTPAPTSANVTQLLAKFRRANIALTGQFLYDMVNSKPGESFVLSAISVLIIFAQLLLYSVGKTREQLLRVTNLDNNEEVKEVIPALLTKFQDQVNVTFVVADNCYSNTKYPLSDKFIQDSIQIFKSRSQSLDFSKNVEAANIINKWVENKTHNEIKDLIPASALSKDTRLVLVNAIFWHGNWTKPFNVKNTKNKDFYVTPNKTISIPIMYQKNTFNYCELRDFQVLEMFYEDPNFSFVIWLPRRYDGLHDLVDELRDPNVVEQSMDCLRPEPVKVSVPRLNILTELNVVDLAKKANVTEMFNPMSNDFRGMLKIEEPVYISDGFQKCKIQSDEKGTTAAVATAFIGARASAVMVPPKEYEFNANHGYAYCVCREGNPIFCGGFVGV